jgi:hypothetical protein
MESARKYRVPEEELFHDDPIAANDSEAGLQKPFEVKPTAANESVQKAVQEKIVVPEAANDNLDAPAIEVERTPTESEVIQTEEVSAVQLQEVRERLGIDSKEVTGAASIEAPIMAAEAAGAAGSPPNNPPEDTPTSPSSGKTKKKGGNSGGGGESTSQHKVSSGGEKKKGLLGKIFGIGWIALISAIALPLGAIKYAAEKSFEFAKLNKGEKGGGGGAKKSGGGGH